MLPSPFCSDDRAGGDSAGEDGDGWSVSAARKCSELVEGFCAWRRREKREWTVESCYEGSEKEEQKKKVEEAGGKGHARNGVIRVGIFQQVKEVGERSRDACVEGSVIPTRPAHVSLGGTFPSQRRSICDTNLG